MYFSFTGSLNIPFMKSGSTSRGERIAKYNRLLEIEEEILKNVQEDTL